MRGEVTTLRKKAVRRQRRTLTCGMRLGWTQMKGCEAASPWRHWLKRRCIFSLGDGVGVKS